MTKRIGVIGAGISGLSIAHLLSQKGYVVDIFEKESTLPGTAAQLIIISISFVFFFTNLNQLFIFDFFLWF